MRWVVDGHFELGTGSALRRDAQNGIEAADIDRVRLGAVWMVVGIAYGAWKTRGFQSDLVNFDVPPEE